TVGLMEALAADGDRAGAIKHAHVYQLLVQQELDLPPDRDVLALADRLRQSDAAPVVLEAPTRASVVVTPPREVDVASIAPPHRSRRVPRGIFVALSVIAAAALVAIIAPRMRSTVGAK